MTKLMGGTFIVPISIDEATEAQEAEIMVSHDLLGGEETLNRAFLMEVRMPSS